jgi:phage terminase large subunit
VIGVTDIDVPYNGWRPRPHQDRLWQYLARGGKRAMAVWHRRAGKDEVCLHHTAVAALERVGNYWHMLPEYAQGRKAIWNAVNPHSGRRRIDEAFPIAMRANTNDNEMFMRFHNGSTWQIVGSDRYDATLGAGPAGVVFSEYALSNPSAWAYIRPMIEENNGWALFITTPRGRNHALDMFKYAQQREGWFAELLSVNDTGALSQAQQDDAMNEYKALYGEDVGRAAYEQEYECSFNAMVLGAFYALEMAQVRSEGRILAFDALPDQPVHHAWDLGVGDDTSIWWFQAQGGQLCILDHYAASGVGLSHYAEVIEQRGAQHGWISGSDYVPHDAKVKELGSGRTRVETMVQLGLKPLLVPLASLDDGINAVRRTLPLCVFHPRCEEGGISALEQYRREWDDDKKCFKPTPLHNWASNPADSFRYLAQGWKPAPRRKAVVPKPQGWHIPPPQDQTRRGIIL